MPSWVRKMMMALGMLLPVLVVGFITMSILEERKRNRNKKYVFLRYIHKKLHKLFTLITIIYLSFYYDFFFFLGFITMSILEERKRNRNKKKDK
jgi:polyferredoxin